MQTWELTHATDEPSVLVSTPEARCIVVDVEADGELGQHQVHERTMLVVIDGSVSRFERKPPPSLACSPWWRKLGSVRSV